MKLGMKIAVRRIGPALVFERLWEETGCRASVVRERRLVCNRAQQCAVQGGNYTVRVRHLLSAAERLCL